MTNTKKISELEELTDPAGTDTFAAIDVSEADVDDQNKEISFDGFLGGMPKCHATKIVAASDTTNAESRSDYQCDGTDDDVEIQAAIDALPASGGRVVLLEGAFALGDTVIINGVDNFYLGGMGDATLLRLADGLSVSSAIHIVTADNILLENFKIDSNGLNQFAGSARNILLDQVQKVIISQVTLINAKTHALEILSGGGVPCQDVIITGCTINEFDTDDLSNDGISIGDEQFNVTIRSCIISHTGLGAAARSGIEIEDGAHDIAITGCIIHGMQNGVNMHVHGAEPAVYGVTVQSCTIYDAVCGIRLNGDVAAHIYGVTLSDNVCHDNANGIQIIRARCTMIGNVIFSNTGYGVTIYQGNYCTVSSAWVWDNSESGIALNQSDYAVVTDSVIFENTMRGIELQGAVTGCNRCIISNNQIIDNDEGDANSFPGIYVSEASHNNTIQGNNFYVTGAGTRQTYGVSVIVGATGNVIIDNQMTQGGRTGPLLDAGTGTVIRGNIGYVTENGGTSGAIATGATIAHGCALTPTIVQVNAAEAGPTDITISVDAANITVNFGGGGNKTFFWYARYCP